MIIFESYTKCRPRKRLRNDSFQNDSVFVLLHSFFNAKKEEFTDPDRMHAYDRIPFLDETRNPVVNIYLPLLFERILIIRYGKNIVKRISLGAEKYL
jgi:hypothetical protein